MSEETAALSLLTVPLLFHHGRLLVDLIVDLCLQSFHITMCFRPVKIAAPVITSFLVSTFVDRALVVVWPAMMKTWAGTSKECMCVR